jgi:hypothetical protein
MTTFQFPTTRPVARALFIILGVGLALRIGFAFVGFPYLQPRMGLREDGDGYVAIARGIREGRWEDPARGPLYPLVIAATGSVGATKLLQAALDTATCALVFLLAGRNLWAAALWAVYPFAIWRVGFINREILLTFLLAAYAWAQLAALRDGKHHRWLSAGLLLGLVNLCKPTFLLWPVAVAWFVGAGMVAARKSPAAAADRPGATPRRCAARFGLLLVGMALVMLPWSLLLHRASGGTEFLPIGTGQGGLTAFIGNYQPSRGLTEGAGRPLWEAAVERIRAENAGASAAELDRAFYRAAWQQARSNPLKAAELVARKAGRFWFFSAARREAAASVTIQGFYLALALAGLWLVRPWSRDTKLMLALVLYLMALHALTYADLRYSLPVTPFVCVFGGMGLRRWLPWARGPAAG